MSIIKSIKQVLGLGPAAENHFWDGSVPNQLSLKRGTPEAPGAELIKALNGVLSFPNQGQSLGTPGYIKLPGGLIIQWGKLNVIASTTVTSNAINYPIPFPNEVLYRGVARQGQMGAANNPSFDEIHAAGPSPLAQGALTYVASGAGGGATDLNWIAVGY